jgi:hypothetical protein
MEQVDLVFGSDLVVHVSNFHEGNKEIAFWQH